MSYTDILIQDFCDPRFQKAFKAYFAELGNEVKDWDGLFSYMNKGEGRPTTAILRLNEREDVVGFLMYTSMRLESWFFSEELGFIREFWVAPELRKSGHGSSLLALAEEQLYEAGFRKVVLTTRTATDFYCKRGYQADPAMTAGNRQIVYSKSLL